MSISTAASSVPSTVCATRSAIPPTTLFLLKPSDAAAIAGSRPRTSPAIAPPNRRPSRTRNGDRPSASAGLFRLAQIRLCHSDPGAALRRLDFSSRGIATPTPGSNPASASPAGTLCILRRQSRSRRLLPQRPLLLEQAYPRKPEPGRRFLHSGHRSRSQLLRRLCRSGGLLQPAARIHHDACQRSLPARAGRGEKSGRTRRPVLRRPRLAGFCLFFRDVGRGNRGRGISPRHQSRSQQCQRPSLVRDLPAVLRRYPESLAEIERAQALDPASKSVLADKGPFFSTPAASWTPSPC